MFGIIGSVLRSVSNGNI
uniref:Uncharacterized protein n=1 Tax=Arundo donax TaxID=35708 RepID=A0A0A9HFA7_ARUDO